MLEGHKKKRGKKKGGTKDFEVKTNKKPQRRRAKKEEKSDERFNKGRPDQASSAHSSLRSTFRFDLPC